MPHQSTATSKKIDAKPHKIGRKSSAAYAKGNGDGAERFHMISEAAYYRALGRGFNGGDPMQDWLMAEEQIDSMSHDREDTDSRSGNA